MIVELEHRKRIDTDEVAAIEYSKAFNLTYITLKSGKQVVSSLDHDAIIQTLIPNDFTSDDATARNSLIFSLEQIPANRRWVGRFYVNGLSGDPFADEWALIVKRVSETLVGLDNSELPQQKWLEWLGDKRPKCSVLTIPQGEK